MRTIVTVMVGLGLVACGGAGNGQTRCNDRAAPVADTGGETGAEEATEVAFADAPALHASIATRAGSQVRVAPNDAARVTILARGNNAFLGWLEMEPGAAVPEHADATEEYIHIIEGGGTITIDGAQHEITAGTTVFMPAGATVSFQNGDARTVGVQVFAGPEPAAKYDRWRALDPDE